MHRVCVVGYVCVGVFVCKERGVSVPEYKHKRFQMDQYKSHVEQYRTFLD